jgi:hypothetical protein
MRRLRKWMQLSCAERRLLLRAWLLLIAVRLGLRTLPFRWLWRFTQRLAQPQMRPQSPVTLTSEIDAIVWAVKVASRYAGSSVSCLPRALTTYLLLGRAGVDANFRLGVVHTSADLEAHAWVEWNGRVLVGKLPDLDRFISLPPLRVL